MLDKGHSAEWPRRRQLDIYSRRFSIFNSGAHGFPLPPKPSVKLTV